MYMKIAAVLLHFGAVLPLWLSLVYGILTRVEASNLMWLMFGLYVPAVLAASVLIHLSKESQPK
jgi:hypothetical protein